MEVTTSEESKKRAVLYMSLKVGYKGGIISQAREKELEKQIEDND